MARKKRRPADDDPPKRKKKPAPREEDEDLDEVDLAEDDEPAEPRKPVGDAYTGLLVITLVALIAACVFFYLDSSAIGAQSVQPPSVTIPALTASPAGGQ
jgi:hypothetical protein